MANEFKIKNGLVVSGSADFEQDLTVRGTITADQLIISIVSSSVLFESGSTQFGNSIEDTHKITGSLLMTGSIDLNGQPVQTGRLAESAFSTYSGTTDSRITNLETSTGSINGYTSSTNLRLTSIETSTGSLNTYSASNTTNIDAIHTSTGSLNTYTSSNTTNINAIHTSTGSLNSYTSSNTTNINAIHTSTASLNSFTSSAGSRLDSIEGISGSIASLNTYTGSNNTVIGTLQTATSSINSFTSSASSRLTSIEGVTGSIASLNTYTGSNTTAINALNSYTSSNTTNINAIHTSTSSLNTFTSSANGRLNSIEGVTGSIASLNTYTGSNNTVIGTLQTASSSLNSYTSSNTTNVNAIHTSTASLNTYTSSNTTNINAIHTSTSSLNSFTSSINTTIKNKLNSDSVISSSIQVVASLPTGTVSGSSQVLNGSGVWSGSAQLPAGTVSGSSQVLNGSGVWSGSAQLPSGIVSSSTQVTNYGFATTGSNTFQGSQTITGSLYISQDLIVAGSSSIQHISSSVVNIGDNIITVNAQNPSIRFGGIAVIDSGSSPTVSGSMLFDSVNNQWLFVHQNQGTVTSSVLLMGPETYNDLGGELYITQNRLIKSTGIEHLAASNISDNGTTVTMLSNTVVNGTFSATGTTLVSGSSQINHNTTTNYDANQHVDHTTVSITAGNGLSGGGTIASTRTVTLDTGSVHFLDGVKKELNTEGVVSGSSQVLNGSGVWSGSAQLPSGVVSGSSQITFLSINSIPSGLVSGSSQVLSGTGIWSGSAQLPSGVVSGSSQISFGSVTGVPSGLVSGSSQITYGSISGIPSGIVSGSSQISFGSISGLPSGLVSGSSQISFGSVTGVPSGLVSGSSQITNIANSQLTNSSFNIGTTSISLGRTSASQTLTGVSIDGNSATVTNGVYTTGDQTIAGVKTFSNKVVFNSAVANRPQFPGGILGLDTGDGNFDIWGISRDYYPSHATAANAWGLRWNGDNNDFEFVGGGTNRVILDMDGGVVTATTFSGALSGNATTATTAGALSSMNISQFTNNSGYITGINSSAVTTALGYTPYNATNPNGYITGISFANVSSKPTTISGYGITDAITTGNIGSQSVSYATTAGALTSMNISQFTNNSGYITGIAFSSVSSKPTTLSGYGITDSLYQDRATINVNSFNATGLYRGSTSGWTNRPTSVHNGGALLTIDTHPGDYHSQLFFDTGGDRIYFRNANAASWGSWLTIYHSGNLTNLNQLTNGPGYITSSSNITGTASNITAYTINQSVGTGNSPTFAGVTITGNSTLGDGNGDTTRINDILYLGASDSGDAHFYFGEDSSSWYGSYWYWDSAYTHYWYSRNAGTNTLLMYHDTRETTNVYFQRHILPTANNTYNLGSTTLGWANVYTNDLHLSNMNKPEGNDIDGTSGNWTIQEGAENLYIINNNNGKKFKISLEEIK